MIERQTVSIGSVAEVKGGKRLPKGVPLHREPNGSPYIRIVDWDNWRISEAALMYVPPEAQAAIDRYRIYDGEVFISIVGSVGLVALLQPSLDGAFLTENAARIRPDPSVLDSRYLKYCLQSPGGQAEIRKAVVGSTQEKLALSRIRDLQVPLPSLGEQCGIAATLGALDEKIESNLRQLHLLDQLFQSHWADVASRASGRAGLADLVSTQYGLTASADTKPVGPKFLRVTDINKRNWFDWDDVPTAEVDAADMEKYRLHRGDLVVARMADPGKSAIYDDESVEAVFASYLVRLKPRTWAESLYLYGFLKSRAYADYAAGAMTGSVQKNMNAKVIVDVELPLPGTDALKAFASTAETIRSMINHRAKENSRLTALRDALIPELMSGRIRVPEAEQAVTGVGA